MIKTETFHDVATEYLADLRLRGASDATIASHTNRLRLFLTWCENRGIGIKDFSEQTFREYLQHLYERPNQRFAGRNLSRATIRKHVDFLKSFARFLMESKRATENYAANILRPRVPKRVPHSFSEEQVRIILEELHTMTGSSRKGRMQKAIFLYLVLDTGLRISEALRLRPCDIDFGNRMLRVIGKGDREREIPFGERTGELLKRVISLNGIGPDDYIWKSPRTGKPFSSGAVRNTLRILRRRLHEKYSISIPISPHVFRHTFARTWIVNGGDQFSLMRMLGHTSAQMTNHYVRLWLEDLKRKHEKVAPAERFGIGELFS